MSKTGAGAQSGRRSLYLLLGPETGKKNAFIGDLREGLAAEGGAPPEDYRFYPFETPLSEVIALMRNPSLFAERKLVIYCGAAQLKGAGDLALLAAYAKSPAPDGVLVFTDDGFQVDKKLEGAVGAAGTVKFWELFENDKKSLVLRAFAGRKVKIGPEAADLFLELVDNTSTELEREASALCFFKGENSEVTVADIETWLYHSREETVFSLFETLMKLDFPASLEILAKLLVEGGSGPVSILAGLLWSFRNLLAYSRLAAEKLSTEDAFGRLRITSKRFQRVYAEGAKNFSAEELENIVVLAVLCDETLRGGGGSELNPMILELFLYGVIYRGGSTIFNERQDVNYEPYM